MKSIDFLEHGGASDAARFAVVLDGESYWMPDPRAEHYQQVLLALRLEHVPETPDCLEWQRRLVFDRWRAAWDLPEFSSARRLAYLVDHYRSAAAFDLRATAGVDLGDLWRARRWTHLLDLLDHLPAHSQFNSTVSMDEEHAKMMAESLAAREDIGESDTEAKGPALNTWTPEMAALTNIFDAVRSLTHTLIAVNSSKGKVPDPPKPAPRPVTPLARATARAKFERRKAAHEALVARVLPHKRRS